MTKKEKTYLEEMDRGVYDIKNKFTYKSKTENNFNEVDGIIPSTSEKDEIHNTKTNLFVDDEHKIKDKDVEENKNEETIIFKTSDSGVFNETEDTELKEDENDI